MSAQLSFLASSGWTHDNPALFTERNLQIGCDGVCKDEEGAIRPDIDEEGHGEEGQQGPFLGLREFDIGR